MLFDAIFAGAQKAGETAHDAKNLLDSLLPVQPMEALTVVQHDPAGPAPETGTTQDPRLVRETMPHLKIVGDYLGGVVDAVTTTPGAQRALVTDPTQLTDAAEGVVKAGQQAVKNFAGGATKPRPTPSDPPVVDQPQPPGEPR